MCYLPFILYKLPFPQVEIPFFIAASCLAAYNIHWLYGSQVEPTFKRTAWTRVFSNYLRISAIVSIIVSLYLLNRIHLHIYYIIPSIILTLVYSAPVIFNYYKIGGPSLRAKTSLLALTWVYTTTLLPTFLSGSFMVYEIGWLAIQQFLFLFPLCLLFDLRHVDYDLEKGIKSIATLLPLKQVIFVYYISLSASTLVALMLIFNGTTMAWVLLIPVIILMLLKPGVALYKNDAFYFFYLDGLMGLSALLAAIVTRVNG